MNWLGEVIQNYVFDDDTVLDIGCGIIQALDGLKCKSHVGVDIWDKYLEQVKTRYDVIKMDVRYDLVQFLDKSFDVVIALDLVEHLAQSEAWTVINQMKRISRKRVIVFTPSKFETNENAVHNAWDLGECPFQKHQCLLTKEDFTANHFKLVPNQDNALLAIWDNA